MQLCGLRKNQFLFSCKMRIVLLLFIRIFNLSDKKKIHGWCDNRGNSHNLTWRWLLALVMRSPLSGVSPWHLNSDGKGKWNVKRLKEIIPKCQHWGLCSVQERKTSGNLALAPLGSRNQASPSALKASYSCVLQGKTQQEAGKVVGFYYCQPYNADF